MTRTRLAAPTLPLFLLAAIVVALLAFGATRWATDQAGADTLPSLEISGDTAAAAPGALDAAKLIQMRIDTVVSIEATIDGKPMNGTGVVVDATAGTIVTASHVIKDYKTATDATMVVARFHKGDEVLAQVVAIDQMNDLAILEVDPASVPGLVAAELGDSDRVVPGSEVMALGAPFGFEFTPTFGNVSSLHRQPEARINVNADISDAIQHDAAVNTGNSGGPLFNARGEVIGINQQIASPAAVNSGVSFAVASNLVRRAIAQHRATGAREIRYADLGIRAVDVTPQLAQAANLGAERGALVQEAGDAAVAGGVAIGTTIQHLGRNVVLGDVIVELEGRTITSAADLMRIQSYLAPTEPADLVVVRGGERVTLTVRPVSRAL